MKDQISALMDDELDLEAAEHVFDAMRHDSESYRCWSVYHLIGDSMRGAPQFSPDFQQRLMQRIEAEPTVLAPRRKLALKRSHFLPVAASVAAVMFVGWMALQHQAQNPSQQLDAAPVAQNAVSPESMNSYLAAHHESSPESAMQTAYYVRPVTYSENGN